jgi:hypothetical protein
MVLVLMAALLAAPATAVSPTFYKDILPLLQDHCQRCHRLGEIGPMPLVTFEQVRPWATAIRESVKLRKMPPWFADPAHGQFANDPRLSEDAIARIDEWVRAGCLAGSKADAPQRPTQPHLMTADIVLKIPTAFDIPANSVIDYQYIILPVPFTSDKWVRDVEIRPSDRGVVHHAVLYVRDSKSQWLRDATPGRFYAPSRRDADAIRRTRDTKEDILAIYTPVAPATLLPEGMAKKIPAGSDLVLQLHYTSKKRRTTDKPEIALSFLAGAPRKRIITLQMGRDDLRIPPGERNYRASVSGTLPSDALLISLFPHMHLRGSAFEFDLVGAKGYVETLLRVKPYNFNWQLNYILKSPRQLRKGDVLRWTGYFDNSLNNPSNPDPSVEVTWGEQSWDEMMIGFFDVAVDPEVTKQDYFMRD